MGREVAPNLAHFYGVFDLLCWLAGLASGCYSSGCFTTLHGSGCAIAREGFFFLVSFTPLGPEWGDDEIVDGMSMGR